MKPEKLKNYLMEILNIEGVEAIFLVSKEGKVLVSLTSSKDENLNPTSLLQLLDLLNNIKEAELIFEKKRICMKSINNNYLILIANPHAPMATIRLRCDTIFST